MKQQTAVEWLFEQFTTWKPSDENRTWEEALEQAKQMEKEQIIIAFKSGWNWNSDAEQYYNETYGGQGSPDTSPNTQNK